MFLWQLIVMGSLDRLRFIVVARREGYFHTQASRRRLNVEKDGGKSFLARLCSAPLPPLHVGAEATPMGGKL